MNQIFRVLQLLPKRSSFIASTSSTCQVYCSSVQNNNSNIRNFSNYNENNSRQSHNSQKLYTNQASFMNLCKELEKRSFSNVKDLQERITADLADLNNPINMQNRDILELIALSYSDSDADFLIDAVRR